MIKYKIYKVTPLIYPKYQGEMKIIAVIDQYYLITKILKQAMPATHLPFLNFLFF